MFCLPSEISLHAYPILISFRKVEKVFLVQDLKSRQNELGAMFAIPATSSSEISLLKFLRIYSWTLVMRSAPDELFFSINPGLESSWYSEDRERISRIDNNSIIRDEPLEASMLRIFEVITFLVFPLNFKPHCDFLNSCLIKVISGSLNKPFPKDSSVK